MTENNGQKAEGFEVGIIRMGKSECGIGNVELGMRPPAWKPMAYKPTDWKRPRR